MVTPIDPEFKKYQFPAIAVDVILFAINHNTLQVGLIKRKNDPFKGAYALPGRFVRYDETVEDTAKLALVEKGNINSDSLVLEQLYTFGNNLDRDTRVRTISLVYYALLRSDDLHKSNNFEWFSVYKLPKMAFDHANIIEYGVQRLRNKVLWDDFAFKLLPDEFTFSELQKVHEIILDKELDKRNFRKKIKETIDLIPTGRKKLDGVHRPAALFKVK